MRESWAGIVFALLLAGAFVLIGAEAPDYTAPDREWTGWAADTESANRIAMLLVLLAGVAFLRFAGSLEQGATAGAVGMVGIVIAVVLVGAAGMHGAESDPTVTRSLYDASTPGFLLASVGFAVHLAGAGLAGASAGWTRIVALVGAVAFLLTFLTVLGGDGDESPFGAGYPLGFLCLIVWTVTASLRLRGIAVTSPAQPLPSIR
jgi:hypothetical protein